MKKCYITFCVFFLALAASAQYTWTVRDTFPGASRLMPGSFAVNGKGYLIGGVLSYSSLTVASDVWEYDPGSDSWAQKSNFTTSVGAPSAFTIDNIGYMVGGVISNGQSQNTTSAYNVGADNWTPKANFPESGVSGAFQFVINGLGFVGTGARNGSNTSISMYSYNPTSNSWSSAANFPGASIVGGVAFSIDSFAYAGSGTNGSGIYYNEFYKYNPYNNSWSPIAPFPGKARNGTTCFVLNGKAYVGSGAALIGGDPYALADFYQYDPTTNTWSPVPGTIGRPRHNPAVFVIGNIAYTACGYDDDGAQFYNFVNEFGTCSEITGLTPMPGGNNKAGLEIYPNPSTNEVNVKILTGVTSEIKYEVVSVDGKHVKTGTTRQSNFGFSANTFADGVYILTITDSNGTQGAERFEVIH